MWLTQSREERKGDIHDRHRPAQLGDAEVDRRESNSLQVPGHFWTGSVSHRFVSDRTTLDLRSSLSVAVSRWVPCSKTTPRGNPLARCDTLLFAPSALITKPDALGRPLY